MSTAHRPNFTAAKGRESKAHLSAQRTTNELSQHTKLKFRQPASAPSAVGGAGEGSRNLKRELEEAEWEARNRRRVKDGLQPIPSAEREDDKGEKLGEQTEEARRRKEALQQALLLDRDSDASSSSDSDDEVQNPTEQAGKQEDLEDSEEEESDSDSEDEQSQLLRELEKIRSERAAEKQRLATLASTNEQLSREDEIARGNPLLNLQNAFQPPSPSSSSMMTESEGDFAVKKRWDHDVIFKNQAGAAGNNGSGSNQRGFVNDLTRSEFHKKFMNRYIK